MKRNRRPKKTKRIFSTLAALLLAVSMMGSTITTAMAAQISDDADAGQTSSYSAVDEYAGDTGDIQGDDYAGDQNLVEGDGDSYESDANWDEGDQSEWEGSEEYGSADDAGEELSGVAESEEDAEALVDGSEEDAEEDAESDYTFVAEYQGGAYQVGSEEELSPEDFVVYVYDTDGNLVDTLEAESVTSDYEVDEDGYILALVVCIYGGETIEVEAKIMAIDTLATGDVCAFAFYCADDKSLNFYYGEQPATNTEYDGKTVTAVYTGFDTASAYSSASKVPWYVYASSVTEVVVDESFKTVQPKAMKYWFDGFTKCVEFIGLENIDTSSVTTMEDTFHNCTSVTSLDISSWDTSSVENMAQMFYLCSSITSLNVSGLVTSSATTINGMLRGLSVLTEIDLSGWDTSNVTKINAMIRDNPKLTTIYVDKDWDLGNVNVGSDSQNVFAKDFALVGGNGTIAYSEPDNEQSVNSLGVNYDMAHIDTPENPGYFTDVRTITTVNVSGTKVWDDANDQDGIRPESVTVHLLANGDETDSTTVTAEDDWSFVFSGLPEYDDDLNKIEYTITEDAVEEYTSEITGDVENGYVITNSYTPKKTEVSGTITWADGNNQDGKRPSYVAVQLFAKDDDGGILDTWDFEVHAPENPTYDSDGNEIWTWTQEDLDHYYSGGKEVKYTVIYTGVDLEVYEQNNPNDLDTIYSYAPETTTISGSKTWVDGDNAENTRPESITVRLHANGSEQVYVRTVTAEDDWEWTFADVPVYSNGQHIDYTITEDSAEDYDPTYDGWNITNTLNRGYTSITVMKDWEDANDQDGKRPESVTVDLLANGIETGQTLTLSEENNWEDVFHSLAIDDEAGVRISYTIVEETIDVDGYSTEIDGNVTEGFVITNSYTPEKINVTGKKVWDDADDQDGMRPSSIYVHLLANGSSVDDVQVKADGNGDWTFAFTDLPKYANGTEIEYSVEEVIDSHLEDVYTDEITGSASEGFTITNTHTPELVNGDGTLTVEKVWNDDDDRDGLRPSYVTVHLLADGTEIDSATLGSESDGAEQTGLWQSFTSLFSGTQTLAAEAEEGSDEWTVSFTDLPKYANGKEITYTVTEDSVEGYTAAVTGSVAEGYTITNIHTPATININVAKIWEDEEDQDGKRPVSITVNLLANDEPAVDKNGDAITMVMNESDDWDDSFMNLYKYRDGGTEIVYTIQEDTTDIEDIYTTETTGDMSSGFTITNSYEPELYNGDGTFKVVVVWDDEANNDGIRPTEVNVKLTKNDTTVEGEEMTLTADEVDAYGNWTGTFTGLPKYENGSEIKYSVKEDVKSGYTYRVELLTDEDGNTYVQLTNVHVSVKEDIEVTKIWDDADDQDGMRPKYITLRLLTNGNLYKEKVLYADTEGVEVSEGGNVWTYTMSDIPVDKNGETIEYTMLEVDVDNYGTPEIVTIRGDEITDNGVTYQPYSFEVTNSHTPEQVTVSGTKVWDDATNQDGKRPQFVTLRLYADGTLKETIDVSTENATSEDENVWAWTFSTYDKYADGEEIEYTVEEAAVSGYETEITGSVAEGFTITNSYIPETTSISGSKTWADEDAAETYRPESITIRLHANGNENVYEKTVTAEDDWAWEFNDLPVYSNGHPITYTLTEDAIDDYDVEYVHGEGGTLNVVNTIDPGNTSVTVEKDWEDAENQDGIRPSEITVELVKNGTPTGTTLTLSEENYWEDTFHHLEEYDSTGARIAYTVQEASVDGYDSEISGDATEGYTITNTHTPATIEISGSKVWEDNNDQDGIRPDHITVHLMNGEETLESHTVSAENGWTFKFSDLDQYANGEEISYTIEEAYTAEGYEAVVDGYTITNTHEPEKIDITGTKTWDDDDNRDGIRPTEITISLYAGDDFVESETVAAADGWTYAFTDLDKCANGEEINYSISEEVPDGYHASYTHFSYDVTNTHSPALFNDDGTLSVIMHWDDENDQDGIRPKRTTITLMLDGVPDETITLNLSDDNMDENGNWIGTFEDLYKYADGKEIAYNVEEGVMNGYTYTAELKQDEDTGLYYIEITNTHAAVTSDITVTKVWDDNDNQDGIRPSEVVVNLFSNGSAVKSVTITPGKEGVTVSGDGNEWSYTFENMPVDQNGEPIIYTLDEVDVGSYAHEIETSAVGGNEKDGITYTKYDFTVTNSHTPATTEVNVSKIWEDESNQDGIRPHSITLELLIDGEPALDENGDVITGTMVPDTDDHWIYTFTGIDKYANGVEIEYGVEEFDVDGYEEVSLTGNYKDGYVITNRHTPETRTISGNKVWNDDNDAQDMRPESITINLYANGLVKESRTITEDDDWAWTFDNLPAYENGKAITYITTETAIDDYDTTYSGFTLTNTLEPGETSVTVAKDWEDEEDQDDIRPNSVTVKLLADGVETGQTLTLSESDNWEDTFHEVPINDENGKRITYTIEEEEVEGYTCEISGDASIGFEIINTHIPETVSVSGSKIWDDADDQDGLRPESIAVYLLADGEPLYQEEVAPVAASRLKKLGSIVTFGAVSAEDDWSFEFTDLPKYENGKEITYTIAEAQVQGYESEITGDAESGYVITNTHTPETTTVSGTKVWQDGNDQDGKRPGSITLNLQADGATVQSLTVTDTDGDWGWTFTNLPKYASGELIEYTVTEDAVEGYETQIAGDAAGGYTIINSHTPETLTISGSKTWDDEDNQDGNRPGSVTIRLHSNGEVIATRTVTAYDGWVWTFSNEPKYEGGVEIAYTITEDAVDDYSSTVNGYDVTNSYTPGQTSLTVMKDWEDANDQDGLRPKDITIELLADGVSTGETLTLSEENDWEDTFAGLDEYKDEGIRIVYTVKEIAVDGYTSALTGDATEGYVFTNTHTPAVIDVTGFKKWEDEEDQDGIRPESITLHLFADGEAVKSTVVEAAEGSELWGWAFENLPKYANGNEIIYTVTEDEVDGYTSEITGSVAEEFLFTNTHEPEPEPEHEYDYNNITWHWADDHSSATAIVWCKDNDGAYLSVEAVVTSKTDADGHTTYTATITDEEGNTYSTSVTVMAPEPEPEPEPETLTVSGSKTWEDADNQDGKRPDSITIRLHAGADEVECTTISAGDGWTWTFTDLPKYTDGVENVYTITEDAIDNYSASVSGYDVTNSYTPEQTSLTVVMDWEDHGNQDGIRPESVTVELLADGAPTGETLTLSAANNWEGTFTGLDEYKDGVRITYSVRLLEVDGYDIEIQGNEEEGYIIVGTHETEPEPEPEPEHEYDYDNITWHWAEDHSSATATVWCKDDDGAYLTIDADVTEAADADGNTTYTATITDSEGNIYTNVVTIHAENPEPEPEPDPGPGPAPEPEPEPNPEPEPDPGPGPAEETVDVSGSITWIDDNNKADSRPSYVTVHLYAGDVEVDSVKVTAEDGWKYSFMGLPKYDAEGNEIVYSVTEDPPYGYDVSVNGYDITNTLISVEEEGGGGGNGGNPTGTPGGQTGDTNTVPILFLLILMAAAAAVVALVIRMTGSKNRRIEN